MRRVGSIVPTAFAMGMQSRNTTIVSVRKGNQVVIMGDRQVTLGERIVAKSSAKKLRRAGDDKIMCGFAGSTADAITLLDKLEGKLQEFPGQLTRAAVELAKEWRNDKILRRLEASLIVCDGDETLEIDGQGNVITPEADGIVAIGSGGTYAKAAARALIDIDGMTAEMIAEKAIKIATDIDVFSNGNWDKDVMESFKETKEKEAKEKEAKEKEAKAASEAETEDKSAEKKKDKK